MPSTIESSSENQLGFIDKEMWTSIAAQIPKGAIDKIVEKTKVQHFDLLWNGQLIKTVYIKLKERVISVLVIDVRHFQTLNLELKIVKHSALRGVITKWRNAIKLLPEPRPDLQFLKATRLRSYGALGKLLLDNFRDCYFLMTLGPPPILSETVEIVPTTYTNAKDVEGTQPPGCSYDERQDNHVSDSAIGVRASFSGRPPATFEGVPELPSHSELANLMLDAREVFILQNRLTLMDFRDFRDALKLAVHKPDVRFRCTLYHPKSVIARDREREIQKGDPGFKLTSEIEQCIERLRNLLMTEYSEENNCEFRFVSTQIPYTIYGFDNLLYLGWLVIGGESNDHPHLVLRGPGGVYEAVRNHFEFTWNQSAGNSIDFKKPLAAILASAPATPKRILSSPARSPKQPKHRQRKNRK